MSQLDNKNKAKKALMFLLFFTVICIAITFACIYNTLTLKKEATQKQEYLNSIIAEEKFSNKKKLETIKLTDKYLKNSITTEERRISVGDIVYEYGASVNRKLEINYIQIDGLKNKTVQDSINKEIENSVLSLRNDEELNDEKIDNIGIYAYILGNFSDVLSIIVSKQITFKTDDLYDFKYEYLGLNYSLEDGKKIEFNSLFTENASIKNIITQSVYDSLAWEFAYSSGDMGTDMEQIDYGEIEDKTFKILAKYNRNPNLNFYFSPTTITIIEQDNLYNINMQDFYENIAIYNRYKSDKNLYEKELNSKAINYVFSKLDLTDFIIDERNKTDNFHYRIIINNSREEKSEKIKNVEKNIQDAIYKKINEYALIANKNKDKGYLLDVIYYVSEYDGKISYNYVMYLCSTQRNYFDKNLEDLFSKAARQDFVELWAIDYSYIDPENVDFEEEVYLYVNDSTNPIEKEEITTKADREMMQ